MTRSPRLLLLVASLLAVAAPSLAQSPFALTHLGVDVESVDARIDGRGGWGLAESDTLVPSFANIAGLPGLKQVAVVLSGYGERSSATSGDDTRISSTTRTPSLRAAIPFREGRLVLTGGFHALRATQYDWAEEYEREIIDPDTGLQLETLTALRYLYREGTQFEVPFGAAYRVHEKLGVGVTANLANGLIRERLSESFIDHSDSTTIGLLSNSETIEDTFDGVSTTLSVLVNPVDRVGLGFTYTDAYVLDVDRTQQMTGLAEQTETAYEMRIPESWTAGLALDLGTRWRMGADYGVQRFSEFEGRGDWEDISIDAWKMAVGFERREAHERRGGTSNMPLRIGYAMKRLPYLMQGEEIMERRISIGTGVPFRNRSGHLDLALSYIWTGDEEKHGVEDHTWRFSVSLAGLEKWW